jgi:hypothetical protein
MKTDIDTVMTIVTVMQITEMKTVIIMINVITGAMLIKSKMKMTDLILFQTGLNSQPTEGVEEVTMEETEITEATRTIVVRY